MYLILFSRFTYTSRERFLLEYDIFTKTRRGTARRDASHSITRCAEQKAYSGRYCDAYGVSKK